MKKKTALAIVLLALSLFLLSVLYLPFIQIVTAGISSPTNFSYRVITRVNVSNSAPFVTNLSIQYPVNLQPNTTINFTCNATVLDYQNWSTIRQVNMTFFSTNLSNPDAINTNRSHYDMFNCTSSEEIDPFSRRYNCWAMINYNAFFDNWTCNISANDEHLLKDSSKITTTVNDLISFAVPDTLDFGDVPVTNTSANFHLNMTNIGNQPINFSAYAYAIFENDSAVMLCEQGNITIGNMKFSKNQTDIAEPVGFDLMEQVNNTNLSSSSLGVIAYPFNETLMTNPVNGTTWRLTVPIGPAGTPSGLCNGSLIITAFKESNSVS